MKPAPCLIWIAALGSFGFGPNTARSEPISGFRPAPWANEQTLEFATADDYRVLIQASRDFDPANPTVLIIYATPNGNTIEQTLGSTVPEGGDWRRGIQQISAQVRTLRGHRPRQNLVLACVEAQGLSWPAWKRTHPGAPKLIRGAVERLQKLVGPQARVVLSAHSGGGSFVLGFLETEDPLPPWLDRIVLLDANYSFAEESGHGRRLVDWLKNDHQRCLVSIAYDDREITLNGKKVIGPEGGTFRATERMFQRFSRDFSFTDRTEGPFVERVSSNRQIHLIVHKNPENKILHTALVGEMNGLLHGLTLGDTETRWGKWGGPRAYEKAIQPAPSIPKRPPVGSSGGELFGKWQKVSPAQREEAILREILAGNFPTHLRDWKRISYQAKGKSGKDHAITIECMPDYLAVGDDADFVRVPMNPLTACLIADAFGCQLPTRYLVETIHAQATDKPEPIPLTEKREEAASFLRHHLLIESRRGQPRLGTLISGIKKDLVVTNRLEEKPHRLAIYGWHKADGKPIQPLNLSHNDRYVDYSHGVRLIRRQVWIDGQIHDIRQALYSAEYAPCFSDEGILRRMTY